MLKRFMSVLLIAIMLVSIFSFMSYAENEQPNHGDLIKIPKIEAPAIGEYSIDNPIEMYNTYPSYYHYVGTARYWGIVRYYDYNCYKHESNYYCMTGLNLSMALYHTKNKTAQTLSCSISQTYSSTTARNFSLSLGAEAGEADMIKASVGLGYGVTQTKTKSYTISSTISSEIPIYAETGYYKLQVCHNFYSMLVEQCKTDGTFVSVNKIAMPYGESYAATLYSANNDGNWKKY